MDIKSFKSNLINFLNKKNCKRLFVLFFCMSALLIGFQKYKGQKTFSSTTDSINLIESKTNIEIEDITSNTTPTSQKNKAGN